MPYKRRRLPRRPRRARRPVRRFRRNRIIPRGLRQATYPLQREKTFFVNTSNALPTGWDYGTVSNYHTLRVSEAFSLADIPQAAELTPVFRAYKLNCVLVTITPLHNSSMFTSGSAQNYYGANMIVYAQRNRLGAPLDSAITQEYWDQAAGKITRLMTGNKSISFKVYPKILSNTYITTTSQTTTQRRPGWNATTSDGLSVPHFGLNMQFSYTDPGQQFFNSITTPSGVAPLNFRITYKYLFQVRGLH